MLIEKWTFPHFSTAHYNLHCCGVERGKVNIIEEKGFRLGKTFFSFNISNFTSAKGMNVFVFKHQVIYGFRIFYQLSVHIWNQHMQERLGD